MASSILQKQTDRKKQYLEKESCPLYPGEVFKADGITFILKYKITWEGQGYTTSKWWEGTLSNDLAFKTFHLAITSYCAGGGQNIKAWNDAYLENRLKFWKQNKCSAPIKKTH